MYKTGVWRATTELQRWRRHVSYHIDYNLAHGRKNSKFLHLGVYGAYLDRFVNDYNDNNKSLGLFYNGLMVFMFDVDDGGGHGIMCIHMQNWSFYEGGGHGDRGTMVEQLEV